MTVYGANGVADHFLVSAGAPVGSSFTQVSVQRSKIVGTTVTPLYTIVISQSVRSEGDRLVIDARGGNDLLDASGLGASFPDQGILPTNQIAVTLIGGEGDDRLIGTPWDDILDSGLGDDTVTGGDGRDEFFDEGGHDTLIETFDRDIGLFDNALVVGEIVGDGKAMVVTALDGVTARHEVQRIQHAATGGTFQLRFDGQTTSALAWNASAAQVESALQALSNITDVAVARTSTSPFTWLVTFLNARGSALPQDVPIMEAISALTAGEDGDTEVRVGTVVEAVLEEDAVAEVQRIQHSGAGGTFSIYLDSAPAERVTVAWNVTAAQLKTALELLSGIGTVSVALFSTLPWSWQIEFFSNAGKPVGMPQLRVDDTNLTPGGTIGNSATADELQQTFKEDDPSMRLPDGADRYTATSIVEDLKGIFEVAVITGGDSRNILVVGDADGLITVGNVQLNVTPWSGRATLDNGRNAMLDDRGFLNELYVINLGGGLGGGRIAIRDTGEGSGVDEIIVNGTAEGDEVTLDAVGAGSGRTGSVTFGALSDPNRNIVTFQGIEFVSINTLGGDDRVLSNDTAAITLLSLGTGDDTIVIGTVPLKPDTGNRTLEFPDGVPVVDTENLTNGNSNPLYVMGEEQNDEFEVNFNRTSLYLHGGKGDDRFLLKTFLVLREDEADPSAITNLARVFGGEGSNRYQYLENGPVEINGGPGIDTLVIVGTPIGDVFVITSTVVAGAGRVVSFRGIEALEIDGGGGNDHIYILSTSANFTTTIVGGSGDDVIHLGGDHPTLIFDPPSFTYTPPAIQVQLPPQLEFVQETLHFGSYVFDFHLNWWTSLIALFSGVSGFLNLAVNAVQHTINGWFDAWSRNIPNFRNPQLSVAGYSAYTITERNWFGLVTSRTIRVVAHNLTVSYEYGKLVQRSTQIQPAPIVVDPPPFAFKIPATFTVEGIQGRVILDGGETFESGGDTVIVHNSSGLAQSGLITNRLVPRYEQVGSDADGNPVFEPQLDEFDDPIEETFVSIEGFGLNIPLEGFTGRDGVKTYGILLRGIENIDLRLADEQPNPLASPISRSDHVTVALLEQRGSSARNATAIPVPHSRIQPIALRIVLGAGDDTVVLRQTTGPVTIYGGPGNDTVLVHEGGSLGAIGGEVRFDGAAHIDERTTHVAQLSDIGLPNDLVFPLVFVNTATPPFSFTDARGRTIRYSSAQLQPILFTGADGKLYVNAVVLRDDGEIVTDLVREQGVHERGSVEQGKQKRDPVTGLPLWLQEDLSSTIVETGVPFIVAPNDGDPADPVQYVFIDLQGRRVLRSSPGSHTGLRPSIVTDMTNGSLVYLDPDGHKTFASSAAGFPLRKSFTTDFTTGAPLYVDTRGTRTDVAPSVLVVDTAGTDFRIHARPVGTPNWGAITVEVSSDGATWVATSNSAHSTYSRNYEIEGTFGAQYRYLRIVGSSSANFQLDAVEILPFHGGPENSTPETRFATSIRTGGSFTTLPTNQIAGVVGLGDGLFANMQNLRVTFRSNGDDLPALIRVNRMAAIPFTRTTDFHESFPGGNDRLVVVASSDGNPTGTLDTLPEALDRIASNGAIELHSGTVTQTFALSSGQTTVTLAQAPVEAALVSVVATRTLALNAGFTTNVSTNRVTLSSPVTAPMVVRVTYTASGGSTAVETFQLLAGASQTLQLRGDLVTGAISVKTYEAVTSFTLSGSTLTVPAATGTRELVVNYAATQRFHLGGELVFRANQVGDEIVLQPVLHGTGEGIYDLYSPGRAPVLDPFGVQLTYPVGSAVQHYAGDPALHYRGEVQRYLGGEPVFDEAGRPVVNFDGSLFTHRAGSVVIHDRRTLAFGAGVYHFAYDPSDLTLELTGAALAVNPNAGIAGWTLDFDRAVTSTTAPDRVVAVVVRSLKGVFALYEGAGFSFDRATGLLTLDAIDPARLAGTVTLEVSVALQLLHRAGDVQQRFGDEEVQSGDAVVLNEGGNFFLALADDGETVLRYTDSLAVAAADPTRIHYLDKRGNRIKHLRGAPVYAHVGPGQAEDDWEQQVYAGGEARFNLGTERATYFGGERAYFSAADAKQDLREVHVLTLDSTPHRFVFSDATFPSSGGTIAANSWTGLDLTLDGGLNTFTIVDASAPVRLWAGGGNDRIAVRSLRGTTQIFGEGGDDTILVGSQAGLWSGVFRNELGHANLIRALLVVDGGSGSDVVHVDDTADLANDTGTLTSSTFGGYFGAGGSLGYTGLERLDLLLGDAAAGNTLTIDSTHGSASVVAVTNVVLGSGADVVNVRTIAGATTIETGTGDDTVRVGSTAGVADPTVASTLNGILNGLLLLTDAGGGDSLSAYDSGDDAQNEGRLTSTRLTGLGMSPGLGIEYHGFETLELHLSDGRDVFHVESTPVGSTLYLHGGDETVSYDGDNNVLTPLAGDLITIESTGGVAVIDGGAGLDTFRVNFFANGTQTNANGVGGRLTLRGGGDGDLYEIGLSGTHPVGGGQTVIDVEDGSPAGDLGVNVLRIMGTNAADFFMLRANPALGVGVVAAYEVDANLNPVAGGAFERVNYDGDINGGLQIFGREGDDVFVLDDNLAPTTIYGDAGADTFQIGQVFASPRDGSNPHNGLDPLDYFPTTQTTRGWLSNGISHSATIFGGIGNDSFTVYRNRAELFLFGEEDDDSFRVRAFVRVNPNDPDAPFTNINGGQGADFISYTVNAPVRIEGGDGLDTLTVVGTEFGDDFVVTDRGIFGAGLFITYSGLEKIVVDALEGNDRFFISSTNPNVILEVVGGLGSDVFNIGGGNGGLPVSVVANSLQGHSGLIEHFISSSDADFNAIFVQGLSVKVADNDEAGIVLHEIGGPLRVFENPNAPASLTVRSYTVVLTRAPEENVRVTAAPVAQRERERLAGGLGIGLVAGAYSPAAVANADGVTLLFDRTNWFIPQLVTVIAFDDDLAEGTRAIPVVHTVVQGASPDDGGAYDGLALPAIVVTVVDDDAADVTIVPVDSAGNADDISLVAENASGSLPATDGYAVILNKAPVGPVLIKVAADGETRIQSGSSWVSEKTLEFTDANWNVAQIVRVMAHDDSDREAIHFSRITHTLLSPVADILGVTAGDVAHGLAAAINGDVDRRFAATVTGTQLTITGPAFALETTAGHGALSIASSSTRAYAGPLEVALTGAFTPGTTWTLLLDGAPVSVSAVTGDTSIADARDRLVAAVAATGAFTAVAVGNQGALSVQRADGTPFGARLATGGGLLTGALSTTHWSEVVLDVVLPDPTGDPVAAGTGWTLELAAGALEVAYGWVAGTNGDVTQPGTIDFRVTDDDAPGVLVIESGGSTNVIEPSRFVVLGDGFVTQLLSTPGQPTRFVGDFGTSVLNGASFNNSIFTAQDLGLGKWSQNANPDFGLLAGATELAPHVTVRALGNGDSAFFKLTITDDMRTAGGGQVKASFDIDRGFEFGDSIVWFSLLKLYNSGGDQIARGAGYSNPLTAGGQGSSTWLDDYLEYTFTASGDYYVEVDSWLFTSGLPVGVDYELQVQVQHHPVADFVFAPSPVHENEQANNTVGSPQSIDAATNFFRFFDPTVGNGGSVNFQTPYARVIGSGDGTFDIYSFQITEEMLNPAALTPGSPLAGTVPADGPFFTSVTLKLNGTVRQGDTWKLGLRYRDYTFVAPANASLQTVAQGLASALPARFTAQVQVVGGEVFLTIADPHGFNLRGITVDGVTQNALGAATVTRSTTPRRGDGSQVTFTSAQVTLTGTVSSGEFWSLVAGGQTAFYLTEAGDDVTKVAEKLAGQLTALGGTATGPTLTLAGTSFTVAFSVAGRAPTGAVAVDGVPVQADAATIPWTQTRFTLPTARPGETWTLTLNDVPAATPVVRTAVVGSTQSAADVADALRVALASSGYTASVVGSTLTVSRATAFTATLVPTVSGSHTVDADGAVSHVVTLTSGYAATDTWTVTLSDSTGTLATRSASGATLSAVASALASGLSSVSGFAAVVTEPAGATESATSNVEPSRRVTASAAPSATAVKPLTDDRPEARSSAIAESVAPEALRVASVPVESLRVTVHVSVAA